MAESNSLSILTLSWVSFNKWDCIWYRISQRLFLYKDLKWMSLVPITFHVRLLLQNFPHCISWYNSDSGNTVNDTKFMVNGCSWLKTLAVHFVLLYFFLQDLSGTRNCIWYLLLPVFLHCSIISLAVYPLFIIANVVSSPDSVPDTDTVET